MNQHGSGSDRTDGEHGYVAPTLTVLGTVEALTQGVTGGDDLVGGTTAGGGGGVTS